MSDCQCGPMNFPSPEVETVREDRYTFRWSWQNAPRFTFTRPYGKRRGEPFEVSMESLFCRFTPEGDILSMRASGHEVKKDGQPSSRRAYFPWDWERENLADDVRAWRSSR